MENAIVLRLLGDSGVAALVSVRIYPVSRDQGSALPAVTVARISGRPVYVDTGDAGLSEARIQIDCWGADYPSAKNTAAAVKASLSGFFGTLDGVTFQNLLIDAERDSRESGGNQSEYLFRTSVDFIVWFKT